MFPDSKAKLWLTFLTVYDKDSDRVGIKRRYQQAAASLNIPWCTPCQTNSTFNQFMDDAEDLSPEDIQNILNPTQLIMPVKKTAKKTDLKKTTKAVKKPKAAVVKPTPTKAIEPEITTPEITTPETPVVKTPQTLPGGIKFLYIPKRK